MGQSAQIIEFNKNEITAFNEFRSQLAELRQNNEKAVFDYKSPKGNKEARSHIYKLRQTKSAVDKVRKEQKAEALEYGRKVDSQAKEIASEIEGMIAVHEQPLKEIEQREAARIQTHKDRIETLTLYRQAEDAMGAEEIAAAMASVEAFVIDDSLEEFKAEAALVKDEAMAQLKKMLAAQKKYEAEQAELVRLREQAADQERKDREAKIAQEARERAEHEARARAEQEQKAREQADRDRQLELERAKREKLEAEQRARESEERSKREAQESIERAERDRQAKIEAEKKEAEQRERNRAHKAKVNNEIVAALVEGGMSQTAAKQAVTLIAKRSIPHVAISY